MGNVYTINNKTKEIWADNVEGQKERFWLEIFLGMRIKFKRQERLKSQEIMWKLKKVLHHSGCLDARATIRDINIL